jgi:hypothetical protein
LPKPTAGASKHTTGQTWAALKKCWHAYRIAKVRNEREKMLEYAKRIRSLEQELGVAQASFPDLGL